MNRPTQRRVSSAALLLATLLVAFGAVPAVAWGPFLTRHYGSSPTLDSPSAASQGDPIYAEFDYPLRLAARLLRGVGGKRWAFEEGEIVKAWIRPDGDLRFCASKAQRFLGLEGEANVCLFSRSEEGHEGEFTRWVFLGTPRSGALPHPVPYELREVPATPEEAEDWPGDMRRFEILYGGAGGGVLRLLYREYLDDLLREAFSQELTYDLPESLPFTLNVKGAAIEVLAADNAGIRYRMLRGFTDHGSDP